MNTILVNQFQYVEAKTRVSLLGFFAAFMNVMSAIKSHKSFSCIHEDTIDFLDDIYVNLSNRLLKQ
jgi:hypothetical protein